MRILVTGSSGFIGSHLLNKLSEDRHELSVFLRTASSVQNFQSVQFFRGDFFDVDSLKKAVENQDIIIHCGGVTKVKIPADFYRFNTEVTCNLTQAVRQWNPNLKLFIYFSSLSAAGPLSFNDLSHQEIEDSPVSHYGKSKKMAEDAVKESGLPFAIVRPPAVYGPGDRDIFIYFKLVNSGIAPVMGDGKQMLSLVFVQDLVEGLALIINHVEKAKGQVFYFNDGHPVNWREIRETMIDVIKPQRVLRFTVPVWLLYPLAVLVEGWNRLLGRTNAFNREKVFEMKQISWLCSSGVAQSVLGYTPAVSLASGFKKTWQWYLQKAWIKS